MQSHNIHSVILTYFLKFKSKCVYEFHNNRADGAGLCALLMLGLVRRWFGCSAAAIYSKEPTYTGETEHIHNISKKIKYKNLKCVLFMALLKSISRLEVAFYVYMLVVSVTRRRQKQSRFNLQFSYFKHTNVCIHM